MVIVNRNSKKKEGFEQRFEGCGGVYVLDICRVAVPQFGASYSSIYIYFLYFWHRCCGLIGRHINWWSLVTPTPYSLFSNHRVMSPCLQVVSVFQLLVWHSVNSTQCLQTVVFTNMDILIYW